MQTRATRDGDAYVLNGAKRYITNANKAALFTVMARTDPDQGRRRRLAPSWFRANLPGLSVGKPEKKMGQQGAHICDVIFDNVRVPVENRLGEEGEGFKVAMQVLDRGRLHISAVCVGVAERLLADCVAYAAERKQFGQPIAGFQLIQGMIADSKTEAHGRPGPDPGDRPQARRRRERHPGGGGGQILRLRNGRPRRRPGGADLRRAPATSPTTASSGSTATCASSASTKAPARSSRWSSPARR